jgi:hypothetical protein
MAVFYTFGYLTPYASVSVNVIPPGPYGKG